jgi:dTDP-4-amino-4,6-dideoxygalactose transaminase
MNPIKPFYFDITPEEIARYQVEAAEILRSGQLVLGEHTRQLEQGFADFVGTRHAIAVNTGSSALEILLRIQDVQGKTVLVPTNTNFATVTAVMRAGGRVVLLDMSPDTFAPTFEMVRNAVENRPYGDTPLAGVLWVHIGGVIATDFPLVVDYCRARGLFVLEDAAHAHGSALGGIQAGNLADGAAFSFFATKVMTTCEGGMITTNDDQADYLARSFRNQGKRGMDFGGLHTDFGDSSRITELTALLGRIQLAKLPNMLEQRQTLYQIIAEALNRAGIGYVSTGHMDRASQYKLIVRLPSGLERQEVKASLAAEGIALGGTVYEIPCHQQPVFAGLIEPADLFGAEQWCPRHICPPLTTGMDETAAHRVADALVRQLS